MKIKVLVADDHPAICLGFKQLVEASKFINVIGSANNGDELLQKYFNLKPDIIVVDISMPVMDGMHAFKEIKKKDNNVKRCSTQCTAANMKYLKLTMPVQKVTFVKTGIPIKL